MDPGKVKDRAVEDTVRLRQVELNAELGRLRALLRDLGAEEVWVFGSLERGGVHENSDLDLLVVMDTALPFVERLAHLYKELKPRVATDLFVYTPGEMADLQMSNPLVRTALREGRRL